MTITLENYEAFFLDYLEGNLSSSLHLELEVFLSQNPNLATELSEFTSFTLEPETVLYPDKDQIKKTSLSDEILENQYIAFLENDLEALKKETFQAQIFSDSELKKELLLFSQTQLLPDTDVVCPQKNRLKRKTIAQKTSIYFSIAASLALLFLLFKPQANYKPQKTVSFSKIPIKTQQIVHNQTIKKQKTLYHHYQTQPINEKIIELNIDTLSISELDTPEMDTSILKKQALLEEKNQVSSPREQLIRTNNQEFASIEEFVKEKINIPSPNKTNLWNFISQSIRKVGEWIGYDMNLEINQNDEQVESWAFESEKIKLSRK